MKIKGNKRPRGLDARLELKTKNVLKSLKQNMFTYLRYYMSTSHILTGVRFTMVTNVVIKFGWTMKIVGEIAL